MVKLENEVKEFVFADIKGMIFDLRMISRSRLADQLERTFDNFRLGVLSVDTFASEGSPFSQSLKVLIIDAARRGCYATVKHYVELREDLLS